MNCSKHGIPLSIVCKACQELLCAQCRHRSDHQDELSDFAQTVRELLVDKLGARVVVVGADFHFGKERRGNVALLDELGTELVQFDRAPFQRCFLPASRRGRSRRCFGGVSR